VIKKILMSLVWFVVFYFLGCMLVGGVAGAIAGGKDPANASQAGGLAGQKAVEGLLVYIIVGAASLAGAGSFFEVLPGTRKKGK
jgi:hypothetical protein